MLTLKDTIEMDYVRKKIKEGSYLPVAWEYREVIEEQIEKGTTGKIFHFCQEEIICSTEGRVLSMEDVPNEGVFIHLDNNKRIRIDRIITLFGKPGAAYDEYDAFGSSCMDCLGGYDKEELDNM